MSLAICRWRPRASYVPSIDLDKNALCPNMPLRSHAPEGNTRPAGAEIVSACWPCNGAMIKGKVYPRSVDNAVMLIIL